MKKNNENEETQKNIDDVCKITEQIAHFKINDNLTVSENSVDKPQEGKDDEADPYKWSIDISNLQKYQDGRHFIFVAVSLIGKKETTTNIDYKKNHIEKEKFAVNSRDHAVVNNMPHVTEKSTIQVTDKGTAIYCLKINKTSGKLGQRNASKEEIQEFEEFVKTNYVIDHEDGIVCYRSGCVSGIPRFIEDRVLNSINGTYSDVLKKFIVLNFNGIYNFDYDRGKDKEFILTERYEYPKCIKLELENTWDLKFCMEKLILCLYDKYLLVEHYKNSVQALEGKI